jgi:hypothetical protein
MNDLETEEREEIEVLLPWYITGRLDARDRAKVETYLASHPDVAGQLDLMRDEREQAIVGNEALGAPGAGALDRLMASLSAAQPSATAGAGFASSAWQQFVELFSSPSARGLRLAAIAAAVLVIIQAATIATLLMRDGGTYQTASGKNAEDGVFALVVFADDAKAGTIAQLLSEFEASIVDGPKAGGVYKVRMREQSQTSREALLRRLAERRDIVKTVLPSRD